MISSKMPWLDKTTAVNSLYICCVEDVYKQLLCMKYLILNVYCWQTVFDNSLSDVSGIIICRNVAYDNTISYVAGNKCGTSAYGMC